MMIPSAERIVDGLRSRLGNARIFFPSPYLLL